MAWIDSKGRYNRRCVGKKIARVKSVHGSEVLITFTDKSSMRIFIGERSEKITPDAKCGCTVTRTALAVTHYDKHGEIV